MAKKEWGFYGRRDELESLTRILQRNRWFFEKVTGRRRIGKTSLVQEALKSIRRERVVYAQIPDFDPAGVISAVRDFYSMFGVAGHEPHDLKSLDVSIAALVREGWIVALDEFQYFHRSSPGWVTFRWPEPPPKRPTLERGSRPQAVVRSSSAT
ncbi:MAG TPA: ATP-binding protein [Myxococcota bacterium]|nr:ATP-binding protein [Myxococcota bacterium]HQK50635.1 ATP-binding protein [Myxococcota bacterium]